MSETKEIEEPGWKCVPTKPKGDRKQIPTASSKVSTSKKAKLDGLLSRTRGATIDQLQNALGWQPHTVRAAISRLRKTGHTIELEGKKNQKSYRLTV